jgi:hypothetical protein
VIERFTGGGQKSATPNAADADAAPTGAPGAGGAKAN